MKYKVTYKNGAVQFGTMNTNFGDSKFLLNLMTPHEGEWVWNHKLGGPSCFSVDFENGFVVNMVEIDEFPELAR